MQTQIDLKKDGDVAVIKPDLGRQPTPQDEALRYALETTSLTLTERRLIATEYAHALNRRGILKTEEEIKALTGYLL